MSTIVHVAGLTIDTPDRTIQRCAVCGVVLCDSMNTASPAINLDCNSPEIFPTWETGRLIEITIGNPIAYHLLNKTNILPDNCCDKLLSKENLVGEYLSSTAKMNLKMQIENCPNCNGKGNKYNSYLGHERPCNMCFNLREILKTLS